MTDKSHAGHCPVCPLHFSIWLVFGLTRKTLCWLKQSAHAYAPLLLRVLLAYEFFEAGLAKLSGDNWFADLTFPFPFNLWPAEINWALASGLEIIAPLALLLGLATRFFSAALIVLTWVAILTVHSPETWHNLAELWQGYAITDNGYGNFKLPLMYIIMLISLLMSGAGRLSLDAWFDRNQAAPHG